MIGAGLLGHRRWSYFLAWPLVIFLALEFPPELAPIVFSDTTVSDRAGSGRVLRWRRGQCCLPTEPRASAARRVTRFSRLNTRPARAPVNASPPPSRASAHDSGSVWVATPSPYGSFIHDIPPVLPAHWLPKVQSEHNRTEPESPLFVEATTVHFRWTPSPDREPR